MKCPNCDKEVSPDWAICPYCKYEPIRCLHCDYGWLPQDAKFCPICGYELNDSETYVDVSDDEYKYMSTNKLVSSEKSGSKSLCLEIEKKVKTIIIDILGVDESQVTDDANFVVDLDANEFDAVELIIAIEKAFDIGIPDEDTQRIATVSDLVKYIQSNCK